MTNKEMERIADNACAAHEKAYEIVGKTRKMIIDLAEERGYRPDVLTQIVAYMLLEFQAVTNVAMGVKSC